MSYVKILVICSVLALVGYASAKSNADYLLDMNVKTSSISEGQINVGHESNQTRSKLLVKRNDQASVKNLRIKVSELTSNTGQKYIGGVINSVDLAVYLAEMKLILADKFELFRQNQANRDHHTFHVTLISPMEYQVIDKTNVKLGKVITITLQGLGRVITDEKTTYFVVGQSSEAYFYRQQFPLPPKDFHVTLGFNPQDIHGVNKGPDTIIKSGDLKHSRISCISSDLI